MGSAMTFRPLVSFLIAVPLAACATPSDRYPSLGLRDAERVAGSFDPDTAQAPPPAPAPPSADLLARLAQLRQAAAKAHAEFLSAVPAAERLARAAGSVGSDSWASAQVALAGLDSARSQAAIALGDLDVLYVDATLADEHRETIGAARAEVVALVEEEDALLARLRARL